MKKIYFLSLFFALFVLSSCSSDDDNTAENYEKIVGTWKLSAVDYSIKTNHSELDKLLYEMMNEQFGDLMSGVDLENMEFKADKTFKSTSPYGSYGGKYVISGNRISFKYDNAEIAEMGNLTWDLTLSDNYMTVSYDMKDLLIAALKAEGVSLDGIKINKFAVIAKYTRQ